MLERLRDRLTDVRYYSLANEFSGTVCAPADAWAALGTHDGARLVTIDDATGRYKIIVDDQHWYTLRPAVEFIPDTPQTGYLSDAAAAFDEASEALAAAERMALEASKAAARAALQLISRTLREAHPDAVLVELVPRFDEIEEYGFLPPRQVYLSDGTELPLDDVLEGRMDPWTRALDGPVRSVWREHIMHFVTTPTNPHSARHHDYLLDLRELVDGHEQGD